MIATYPVKKSEFERVCGFGIRIVEVDFHKRRHQRIVGADRTNPETFGKTLIYSDTYLGKEETSFVYARHTAVSQTFFPELDVFCQSLLSDGYQELSRVAFPIILNVGGSLRTDEQVVPLVLDSKITKTAKFFRMDLPFGAMSIEFSRQRSSNLNELDIISSGELIRAIDSPLIGCEVSRGDTYLPLFRKFHWAAKFIDSNILGMIASECANLISYV